MTLQKYLPSAASLTETELASARDLVSTWLATNNPDLDTRPGSVFDGFFLRQVVQLVAALNRGLELLQADLDMAGVAAGQVTDCDLVQRLLSGLGAEPDADVKQIGYVLLTFSANVAVSIPGGTRFVFGSDVFVPATGTINLQPAGTGAVNRLVRLADNTYAFALQVQGYATTVITQGTTAEIDSTIDGLVGVKAQSDFVQGSVAVTVPQLALLATRTVHHSGFASRGGVIRHIMQQLPDVSGVAVSATGDTDMLRSALTLSGLAATPCMDIRVASKYKAQVSQSVFVPFIADQEGSAVDAFIGVFAPLHVPQRIVSVQAVNSPDVTLLPVWYSSSLDHARAPLLTCAFSRLEQLRVVVPMPRDVTGRGMVELGFDDSSQKSGAWFTVTYEAEPAVDAVQRLLDRDPPIGIDVMARAPTPLLLQSLKTKYSAPAGVLLNSEQLLDDVDGYINGLFGSRAFSVEMMTDFVFSAGAEHVSKIECQGQLRLGLADFVLPYNAPMPEVDYAGAKSARLIVPKLQLTDARLISALTYVDPGIGTDAQTLAAVSPSSVRLLMVNPPVYEHEQ